MISRIVPAVFVTLASITGVCAQSMLLGPATPLVVPAPASEYKKPDHSPPYTKGRNVLELQADNPEDVRFCREYEAKMAAVQGKGPEAYVEAYDPPSESSCFVSGIAKE